MIKILRTVGTGAGITAWFVVALVGVPMLIVLGLYLLGVSMDWSSWKTYVGIVALTAAMVMAK